MEQCSALLPSFFPPLFSWCKGGRKSPPPRKAVVGGGKANNNKLQQQGVSWKAGGLGTQRERHVMSSRTSLRGRRGGGGGRKREGSSMKRNSHYASCNRQALT